MADLGFTINKSDLPEEEQTNFDPLPAGWYGVKITDADIKDTKSGTGQYIRIEYTVIGESYSGRKIWANLNIKNDNEVAQNIGQKQLNSLMGSIGLDVVSNTDQLVGHDLQVKVKITEATDKYEASNDVSSFKALSSGEKPSSGNTGESSSSGKPPWSKKK